MSRKLDVHVSRFTFPFSSSKANNPAFCSPVFSRTLSRKVSVCNPTTAAAYAASKGSVRLLTKSTAVQYGPENIRCNSVHPGFIVTPMTQPFLDQPGGREWGLAQSPLNRLGTVEDIANGVLFLASDESSFMTGSEMVIDGGWTAQ